MTGKKLPIYFIGCDMGGWHGDNDAVAVCKYSNDNLEHVCEEKGKLFFSVSECVTEVIKLARDENAQIIIGIDAALAWPVEFVNLVNSAPFATYCPTFKLDGEINNPCLFRITEKFIKNEVNKKPLSSPGNMFGNNSSKGQALVAWFKKELGKELYRPPFDEWDETTAKNAKYTLIEVYPAASMKSKQFRDLEWPIAPTPMKNVGASDIADAKRAAMTCVCYAATVGKINGDYPAVHVPSDANGNNAKTIQNEGWIFSPKVEKKVAND